MEQWIDPETGYHCQIRYLNHITGMVSINKSASDDFSVSDFSIDFNVFPIMFHTLKEWATNKAKTMRDLEQRKLKREKELRNGLRAHDS